MKHLNLLIVALSIVLTSVVNAQNITVKVHEVKGYGEYEDFARKAAKELEKILNSPEFDKAFLQLKMTQRKRHSNERILQKIKDAKENHGDSEIPHVIDLRLRVMSLEEDGQKWMNNCELDSKAGTIGKDNSTGFTVTCLQRIEIWAQNDNYACLAGHFMHEYMHNLGFSHFRWPKSKSAVYKTGYLVRDLLQGHNKRCPTN